MNRDTSTFGPLDPAADAVKAFERYDLVSAPVVDDRVAAVTGVAVALLLHAAGRDPAQGSSVRLTFVIDAMGFFLFLGLATVFLV